MWSAIEIIQFITLNIISIFFIYFAVINSINKEEKKWLRIVHIVIGGLNSIWIILIYTLNFFIWKSSWGVNVGVNFGFIILDILYLSMWFILKLKK
ncbi:hypothetical protein [Spiroplasma cantharicola]|uniref:Uncharacterized protein n=1 Tax=Spiroplasma cantharicola TaxID=362837 RepID=A0A0M4JSB8_9MOLU|nr:hypothetical protein [Spiroplasma cantharicola]ALD66422.1 hypothetical protein SCANT_v1c05160 [Spiroplasma cantharicola]